MSIENYRLDRELGTGAYSTVYLGYDIYDNPVSIKTIDLEATKITDANYDVLDEIESLKDLSKNGCYEYVVCYYDGFIDTLNGVPTAFIVSEYVDGGSLLDLINSNLDGIRPSYLWPIMSQLLYGLKYIHDRDYAHRDIKPDNILITTDFIIKYIDFGLSCIHQCDGTPGTLFYSPPEFYTQNNITGLAEGQAHDMWSLAIVFFTLCNATYPFDIYGSDQQSYLSDDDMIRQISVAPAYSSGYAMDDGRTNRYVDNLLINDWRSRPTIYMAIDTFTNDITSRVFWM